MANVVNGISTIIDMASTVLTEVVSDPVLSVIFSIGFVGAAIGVVRRLVRIKA